MSSGVTEQVWVTWVCAGRLLCWAVPSILHFWLMLYWRVLSILKQRPALCCSGQAYVVPCFAQMWLMSEHFGLSCWKPRSTVLITSLPMHCTCAPRWQLLITKNDTNAGRGSYTWYRNGVTVHKKFSELSVSNLYYSGTMCSVPGQKSKVQIL